MKVELMEALKLLTISNKCITQDLEMAMLNPNCDNNHSFDHCGRCFVCRNECHGRKSKKTK